MNRILSYIVILLAFGFCAVSAEAGSSKITIYLKNETKLKVAFYLNGGTGLETSMGPGKSATYTMVVDEGGTPELTIRKAEKNGDDRTWTVADGEHSLFVIDDRGCIALAAP